MTKEERIKIIFEPEGKYAFLESGKTLYDAAQEAGIILRTECGGHGLCGKCKIIHKDKTALGGLTERERELLSDSEINEGYRLACQAVVNKNATVVVPPETRTGGRKIQIMGTERESIVSSLVEKIHLALYPPTLSDIRPDLERIIDSLRIDHGYDDAEIDCGIIKSLPALVREAQWDITVTLEDRRRIISIEKGDTSERQFGAAIDIGTSKIVVHIVDLRSGKTIGVGSVENPQLQYGEDIISRITFAQNSKNVRTLQRSAINGINNALKKACSDSGVKGWNIYEASVVGNTAEHHFFLGIVPRYLARSPFVPALKRSFDIKASELGIKINPSGNVHVLPVIAGFVGADAVADVISTEIAESDKMSLLMDIGTNTEIFVGNSLRLVSGSCASGPVFEGAHIKHGMKAVTGAIERVRIGSDYEVRYETVEDSKPVGICGSAMIDMVAELFRHKIINNRGRFNKSLSIPRLKTTNEGSEFVIAWSDETGINKDITVTERDISEIQLAKSAIYAGCRILMRERGVNESDIDRVFIAGAFGNYIDPENAKMIGMIPSIPTEKIEFVGNTAVTGAKTTLIWKEMRTKADEISKKINYTELTIAPDFQREFANALFIPHKDPDRLFSEKI